MTTSNRNSDQHSDPLGGYLTRAQFGQDTPSDEEQAKPAVTVGEVTPWGEALSVTEPTAGLSLVSVPSERRVIRLSPELHSQVRDEWRSADRWYVGTLEPHYVRATFPQFFGIGVFTPDEIRSDAEDRIREHPQANAGPSFARHQTPAEIAAETYHVRELESFQELLKEYEHYQKSSESSRPTRLE